MRNINVGLYWASSPERSLWCAWLFSDKRNGSGSGSMLAGAIRSVE